MIIQCLSSSGTPSSMLPSAGQIRSKVSSVSGKRARAPAVVLVLLRVWSKQPRYPLWHLSDGLRRWMETNSKCFWQWLLLQHPPFGITPWSHLHRRSGPQTWRQQRFHDRHWRFQQSRRFCGWHRCFRSQNPSLFRVQVLQTTTWEIASHVPFCTRKGARMDSIALFVISANLVKRNGGKKRRKSCGAGLTGAELSLRFSGRLACLQSDYNKTCEDFSGEMFNSCISCLSARPGVLLPDCLLS